MPSFDILTLLKEIVRFVHLFRPKLAVVKHFVPAEDNQPFVAITNLSDRSVTFLDAGFVHVNGDQTFAAGFVQSSKPRVEFPKTIEPWATITIRIGPGAEDLWKACDVYAINFNGNRIVYKAEPKFSTAR